MARRVAFISEKGGVGKTTCCYHIAVALARYHGNRVLVVDADYQRGGITGRFFPALIEQFDDGSMAGETLFHKYQQLYSASKLTPDVDLYEWKHRNLSVDLLPSDPRLSAVSVDKLPSSNNIRANNKALLAHLRVLGDVLKALDDEYDYILIDSHPEVSDILRSVIFAADYCVSPVKLDRQSSVGVATIQGEINNVNDDAEMIKGAVGSFDYSPTEFSGAIGMMCREWGEALKGSEQIEFNRLRQTGRMYKNYVTEGDGLRQAAAQRIPVYDIGIANAVKQSGQFKNLTAEFLVECP